MDGGVTWSAPVQLGHPDAINIFPAFSVRSDGTAALTYLTNAYSRRGDTFVVALDLFQNGRHERGREVLSKPFRLPDLSPNPDSALLDCDGFSRPSIAPTPSGFEIVFPATGFNTKAPHDVDLYSSTVDLVAPLVEQQLPSTLCPRSDAGGIAERHASLDEGRKPPATPSPTIGKVLSPARWTADV
jgi:hypothetical protein